jgi:hypothetical protein
MPASDADAAVRRLEMKRAAFSALIVAVAVVSFGARAMAGSGPPFNQKNLKGDYALSLSGTDTSCASIPCPVAITGQFTSDGKGGVTSGSLSISDGTQYCTAAFSSGSYSINKDGTGSIGVFVQSSGSQCTTGSLPITAFQLSLTLYKNGNQAALATISVTPDAVTLSGLASNQKKFP